MTTIRTARMFRCLIFLGLLLITGCAQAPVSDQVRSSDAHGPPAAPAVAPLLASPTELVVGSKVAAEGLAAAPESAAPSVAEEPVGTAAVETAINGEMEIEMASTALAETAVPLVSNPSAKVAVPMFGTVVESKAVESADGASQTNAASGENAAAVPLPEPSAAAVAEESIPKAVPTEPQVPLFTLPSADGRTIALESYLGEKNVVLVFYRGFW